MQPARTFLKGIIDYAGLFPPASQTMTDAVASYASYRSGKDRDLLGRFVVPASRLAELSECAGEFFPRGADSDPWKLSAISSPGGAADRETILSFNCSHWQTSGQGHAVCDSVEIPVANAEQVSSVIEAWPAFFQVFLEVPASSDPAPVVAAMAGTRAAAKLRTGGVTTDSIPDAVRVERFMRACAMHGVPFKATAGLHHALRGSYPLTYEDESPRAVMFGYLNVFLAAAFIQNGLGDEGAVAVLEETNPKAFKFGDLGVSWREHTLTEGQLVLARERFALSYGSCSFTEPVTEAAALGLV